MRRGMSIYKITLSSDVDKKLVEDFVKNELFPTVEIGHQTRGGKVMAQYLVEEGFPHPDNSKILQWIVVWEDTPFGGGAQGPAISSEKLKKLGASVSKNYYTILADERE